VLLEIKSSARFDNLLHPFTPHRPHPFREIKVSARFINFPLGSQFLAISQSFTPTRIPLPTCDLYDMMPTKLLPAHPPSKAHARERLDKISPFVCPRNLIQHAHTPLAGMSKTQAHARGITRAESLHNAHAMRAWVYASSVSGADSMELLVCPYSRLD
jgi:hypothetical protein